MGLRIHAARPQSRKNKCQIEISKEQGTAKKENYVCKHNRKFYWIYHRLEFAFAFDSVRASRGGETESGREERNAPQIRPAENQSRFLNEMPFRIRISSFTVRRFGLGVTADSATAYNPCENKYVIIKNKCFNICIHKGEWAEGGEEEAKCKAFFMGQQIGHWCNQPLTPSHLVPRPARGEADGIFTRILEPPRVRSEFQFERFHSAFYDPINILIRN